MTTARKVFFWILGAFLAIGLAMSLVNLVLPDAVSIRWNEENVEGLGGVPVAMGVNAIFGILLGLLGAGITSIFSRKKKA